MRKIFAVLLSTLFVLSCAKDRTVDDYNSDKIYTDLAELQAVEGTYTGLMTSQENQSSLGALKITLRAELRIPTGPPGAPNAPGGGQPKPTLLAEIEFLAQTRMVTAAQNTYYQPDSGQFEGEIQIRRTGRTDIDTIKISGAVTKKTFSGLLQARGFEGYGGNFSLQRDGRGLDDLNREVVREKPVIDPSLSRNIFVGESVFPSEKPEGFKKPVEVVIFRPQVTGEDEFHAMIVPLKPVVATFSYGAEAQFAVGNAIWDTRTGKLRGQTLLSRSGVESQINTDCNYTALSKTFKCLHTISSSTRTIATTVRALAEGENPPPVNGISGRRPVIKIYRGSGYFDAENPNVALDFTAIWPQSTAMSELGDLFIPPTEYILQASFTQRANGTTTSFSAARWSPSKGELSATEMVQYPTRTVTHNISCQQFKFTEQKTEFTCDYINNANNSPGKFKFRP